MKKLLYLLSALSFAACTPATAPDEKAAQVEKEYPAVLNKAFDFHGADLHRQSATTFRFREMEYKNVQLNGRYQMERIFTDSVGQLTRDVVDNNGFTRYIDGAVAEVADDKAAAYTESVNSVIYFTRLPYGLKDDAVIYEDYGIDTIKSVPHQQIGVKFKQEGGGVDFEDSFVYWFATDTGKLNYLAYRFKTNEGGIRFREAINDKRIEGILFQDYINYKPTDLEAAYAVPLHQMDDFLEAGKLKELSRIENEEVKVVREVEEVEAAFD
jgi:hypothetical protein